MAISERKKELLASIEYLHDIAKKYSEDVIDEACALSEIMQATHEIAYLSQTQVEWAQRILTQPSVTCALRVAIEAKWLCVLADGKSKSATDIAAATGSSRGLLIRMFRILTCEGLVNEVNIATYSANERTRYFMVPVHQDMAKTWFDNVSVPAVKLPEYLSNISYREPDEDAVGPYAFTYGMTSWRRFKEQPAVGESFNQAMTVVKRHGRCPLVEKYPLVERLRDRLPQTDDEVLIVDVGGGLGYYLQQFREDELSKPRGRLILQDLPHVLPTVEHEPAIYADLEEKHIETMAYDFFTPQPIHGALVYHFSAIFHNWPDHHCRRILRSLLPALRPHHSRLLIHDYVLPDIKAGKMQVGFDFTMMAVLCGKERSLGEWEELLRVEGLRVVAVFGEEAEGTKIIECALVEEVVEVGFMKREETGIINEEDSGEPNGSRYAEANGDGDESNRSTDNTSPWKA